MLDSEHIKKHYQNLFKEFGKTPSALQWRSEETQIKRFEILAEISPDLGNVLDVGSGFGDLLNFLRYNKSFKKRYCGIDHVPEFIEESRKIYNEDPLAEFHLLNIEEDPFPSGFDTLLLSGVFNNKRSQNEVFQHHLLTKMFTSAKKQVAINCLSTYVDYFSSDLYYTDPLRLFDFCKTHLTKKVTLRHDYLVKPDKPPFEFTLYLYH